MDEKRCTASRAHKPHLWSRTTRKTVTETTPGDTFQCPGSAHLGLRAGAVDTRGDEIRADAHSGRNWAEEEAAAPRSPTGSYGPVCICGAGVRTWEAGMAFRGVHGLPSGYCARHPGGTVRRASDTSA